MSRYDFGPHLRCLHFFWSVMSTPLAACSQARESPPNSLLPQRHAGRTGGSSGGEEHPLAAGSAFATLTSGTLSPRKGKDELEAAR